MIDLFYWNSPNVHKVAIFLEEAGVAYRIIPVDVGRGEQFTPEFLAISPNNRLPAIRDTAPVGSDVPIMLFESGAILLYLADRFARLIPTDAAGRAAALQWLFWQVGGLGPASGQNLHFTYYAPEPQLYAVERFRNETERLLTVLDLHLARQRYMAGDNYSIADIATYPWTLLHERLGQSIGELPNIARWIDEIRARPAVVRAYALMSQVRTMSPGERTAEERRILFNQTGETVRAAHAAATQANESVASLAPLAVKNVAA